MLLYLIPFGGRSTAIKLKNGDIWLVASTPLNKATKEKLTDLGTVKLAIRFHHRNTPLTIHSSPADTSSPPIQVITSGSRTIARHILTLSLSVSQTTLRSTRESRSSSTAHTAATLRKRSTGSKMRYVLSTRYHCHYTDLPGSDRNCLLCRS
jgi:hypothetical protein